MESLDQGTCLAALRPKFRYSNGLLVPAFDRCEKFGIRLRKFLSGNFPIWESLNVQSIRQLENSMNLNSKLSNLILSLAIGCLSNQAMAQPDFQRQHLNDFKFGTSIMFLDADLATSSRRTLDRHQESTVIDMASQNNGGDKSNWKPGSESGNHQPVTISPYAFRRVTETNNAIVENQFTPSKSNIRPWLRRHPHADRFWLA